MNNSFKLSVLFTDNMVIQRECNVPIWGRAVDGTEIKVEFCGQIKVTTAVGGKWHIILSPLEMGGPYEMRITADSERLVLKNVLIGDVWLAGGQSNMEWILQNSLNGTEEIPRADHPNIRHYAVPKIEFEEVHSEAEADENPAWEICTPENAGMFSAVAFHFAKEINKDLNMPIGIINCNWGGTSASCWMSEEYLEADSDLKSYLDEYNEAIYNLTEEEYENQRRDYVKRQEEYNKKYQQFKLEHPEVEEHLIHLNLDIESPWPPPMGPKCFLRPSGLYYTMLQKVVPYAMKGVIWYQGESDTYKPRLYGKLFSKMIENWRKEFNNPSLPFLFVQLPFFGGENPDGEEWAFLREQQASTVKNVSNTGMAVIIDCGEKDDIHPLNKKTVGERLALLAKAEIYGLNAEYLGPMYKQMNIDRNKVTLFFDHVGDGLEMKGEMLKGFTICGEDSNFVEAIAKIEGDTAVIYSEKVDNPTAVRYGWANYMGINLYSKNGLPAGPFRTDNF